MLLEGAAVLSFAPNAPKQWVCFQTQTTASALGVTLVQMDCRRKRKEEDEQFMKKEWEVIVSTFILRKFY